MGKNKEAKKVTCKEPDNGIGMKLELGGGLVVEDGPTSKPRLHLKLVPIYEGTTTAGERRRFLCPGENGLTKEALFEDIEAGACIFKPLAEDLNEYNLNRKCSIISCDSEEDGLKAVNYLALLHDYLDEYEEERLLDREVLGKNETMFLGDIDNSETRYPVVEACKVTVEGATNLNGTLFPFQNTMLMAKTDMIRPEPYYRNQTRGPIVLVYNQITMPFTEIEPVLQSFSGNRRVYLVWVNDDMAFEEEDEKRNVAPQVVQIALKFNASYYRLADDCEMITEYLLKVFDDIADEYGMHFADDFPKKDVVEKLGVYAGDGFKARFIENLLKRVQEETCIIGSAALKLLGIVAGKKESTTGIKFLDSMVGLEKVKKEMKSYIRTLQYKKERSKQGLDTVVPTTLLMLGPAGTGKTECARALAAMAYEAGVIPKNNVVSITGTELNGQYLGQTAVRVQEMFREAKGGVLFIDEAYSLGDSKVDEADLYSRQAIAQMLVEMDRIAKTGDTIVVLAGYDDRMMVFLDKNPGLRSRCSSFVLRFNAYSASQSTDIYYGICKREGFSIASIEKSSKVRKELEQYFSTVQKQFGFGNGRTARNLMLQTITQIADRTTSDNGLFTEDDINRILPEDVTKAIERSLEMMEVPANRKISVLA